MPTNTTMRALAIGPRELLSGLSAFGVEVRHATLKTEALKTVSEIRSNQEKKPYAIVFITETIVSTMDESEYAELMGTDLPVILTIPDLSSDNDAGLLKLRTLTKRAVGVDVLGDT